MPGTYALPEIFDIKKTLAQKLNGVVDELPDKTKALKLMGEIVKHAKTMDMLYVNLIGDVIGTCDTLKKTEEELKSLDQERERFKEMADKYKLMLSYVKKSENKTGDYNKVCGEINDAIQAIDTSITKIGKSQECLVSLKLEWVSLRSITALDFIRMPKFHTAYKAHCENEFSIENFDYINKYNSKRVPKNLNEVAERGVIGANVVNISYKQKKKIEDGVDFFRELGLEGGEDIKAFLAGASADDLGEIEPKALLDDWTLAWENVFSEIESLSQDTIARFKDNPKIAKQLAKL